MTVARRLNLKKADEVRAINTSLKRRLRLMHHDQACLLIAEYLEADAPVLHRMRVRDLLLSIQFVGVEKATQIERRTGCDSSSRIGGERRRGERVLSERRRLLLAAELRARTEECRVRRQLYLDAAA